MTERENILIDALISAGHISKQARTAIEKLKTENAELRHRAEVAERAFLILWNECKEKLGWNIDCTMWYAKQAKKELAEGKKDD